MCGGDDRVPLRRRCLIRDATCTASCPHGEGSRGAGCCLLPPSHRAPWLCRERPAHLSSFWGVFCALRVSGRRPGDVDVMVIVLHIFAPQERCSQTHYIVFSSGHVGIHVSPSLLLRGHSLYGCHRSPVWVLQPRRIRPGQRGCLLPVSSAGSQTQMQSHGEFVCPAGSP